MKIDEAWLAAHNSDPNLPARIAANEAAPYVAAPWLSPRDYYRNADIVPVVRCHYCGASPAKHIDTETDPVCATCASVWDREPKEDTDE